MVARHELPQAPRERPKGGCDPNARCGNGLEKVYPTLAVRYGYMKHVGEFTYAPGMLFGCRGRVVIQTDRGIEIGEQVSLTCTGCDKSVSREQMRLYVQNSGQDFYRLKNGRVLREATEEDLREDIKIREEADEKLRFIRRLVTDRKIPMKVVACEQLFGGERIVFYFMSEVRVDFRDLVRDLAHEYHTRIELRQVGHRDEARLLADYEICGRECCCKNFLKTLRPVSMQMAKLQKSTLDPSKVSGRCGRLRCCLRYEHEGYEDLNKKLPRVGARVRVTEGVGTVVDRQILTQLLLIEFDNGRRTAYPIEDVLERDLPHPAGGPDSRPARPGGGGSGDRGREGGQRRRGNGGSRDRRSDAPRSGEARRGAETRPADDRPSPPSAREADNIDTGDGAASGSPPAQTDSQPPQADFDGPDASAPEAR
ncbi:MAG: hypothetical protein L6Q92_12790 [Phycisphaerae bacterium]|nr:hypothetical protein [Phycisphaerae bacterium]